MPNEDKEQGGEEAEGEGAPAEASTDAAVLT